MPVKIFCCYAHKDEALLNRLKMQLAPDLRGRLIEVLYDRNISAGIEWEQEIRKYLNEAHIILLLISPDFIASDYCYGIEMKQALIRHERGDARVIPIILRRVYWEGLLGRLQALPVNARPITSWHNRDDAFYSVAQGIRRVAEEINTKLINDSFIVVSKDGKRITRDAEEPPEISQDNLHQTLIWPELEDYDKALIDGNTTVCDPDIQQGKLLSDSRGVIPLHLNGAGAFHAVYKVGDWAVKCFYRNTYTGDLAIVPPPDLRERYLAINEYIQQHRPMLPFLAPQIWVEQGIIINKQIWPFVKSPFLNCMRLGDFLAYKRQERSTVANLVEQWLMLISSLETLHIAHGDLDITNVLVCGNYPDISFQLVDFDNMYVPSLRGRKLYENGHENFQLPDRRIYRFNNEMDRFSALVIYISLIGLSENPYLWEQCGADEDNKLLLGAYDYERLSQSRAYSLLRAQQDNQELQRCLDELELSIQENRMPRSLSDLLMKG